jgi:NAD(P)-dependent dehydrogenase (short-subunit alcohol dehydrogenase family)
MNEIVESGFSPPVVESDGKRHPWEGDARKFFAELKRRHVYRVAIAIRATGKPRTVHQHDKPDDPVSDLEEREGKIAKAVVFLASDDASYMHRIELFVDGGIAQV